MLRKKLEALKSKQKPGQTLTEKFETELDEEMIPPSPAPITKSHDVAYIIINKDELCTAYTDLTGQFTFRSSRGNQYILVGYHYNTNCIIVEPLKNIIASTITSAWTNLHKTFEQAGIAPNTYIMDNDTSGEFMRAIKENKAAYQLMPPRTHTAGI